MPPPPLPVHRLITIEDLRPYSPEELATRPILHPDHAEPFNPDFTWRAYIALSLEGQISEHVAQTLDQLSQTAEGQQLIRQAAAVNQLKPKQYGEAFPFLFITEAPASNQDRESHYDGSRFNQSGFQRHHDRWWYGKYV